MKNAKVVGWGLILSIVFTFLVAIFAETNQDTGYAIAGMMYMLFAIWGGILLINHESKK